MPLDAVITLVVVVGTAVFLALDRVSPAAVLVGAMTTLLLTGVIDEAQAFSGFSNAAPVTVAALYVLAGAAEATGALEGVTRLALGPPDKVARKSRAVARLAAPVVAASAFLPNTPLVSMLAPRVVSWSRRGDRSPSPFLLPLSYAAILGGVVTVLGTSTNLVVSGLLAERGDAPLGIFEITPVGLPIALAGMVLLALISPRLLPDRTSPSDRVRRRAREYTVQMEVAPGSQLAGQTVTQAGLRALAGVYLVGLDRQGVAIAPVSADEVLVEGDHLTFIGDVSDVVDLQRVPGLRSAAADHLSVIANAPGGRLFEVVLSDGSFLTGRTLREVDFRARYGAACFAIHRAGERLVGKLGRVRLRAGDVLVVLAEPGFRQRWSGDPDFLVISPLDDEPPPRREQSRVVEVILGGVVVAAATGVLSLTKASLAGAIAVVALRVLSPAEARRAVKVEILVIIAASFALGAALESSGLAEDVGQLAVAALGGFGVAGIVAGVFIATAAATELLTNNAAAVLMFPIAIATAEEAQLDPRGMAVTVLVAASCSFLTPIGYQTNTMVYGLGGYRFLDFTRVGAPLTLLCLAMTTLLVPITFPS